MLKAAGEEGVELVRKLVEAVFSSGMIPVNWAESFILHLYKGKGEALDRCNYHGLMGSIYEMQFTLVTARVPLMQSLLFASCRRSISPPPVNGSILPSLTLGKPLIVCQERSCGGLWGPWMWMNGLCMSSRACTTMPGAMCRSMINTVQSGVWRGSWSASGLCP